MEESRIDNSSHRLRGLFCCLRGGFTHLQDCELCALLCERDADV